MSHNPLRQLPSVNAVLAASPLHGLEATHSQEVITSAVRAEMADLRHRLRAESGAGVVVTAETVARGALERLKQDAALRLRRVINATGVVLHTNLGRAPLAEVAARAAYEAGRGYLNLELDLATGKRSSRQNPVREILARLTGAESATAVNNCAAATVITLRTLATGKEVIVSRGQLIEIGGSFRIPDIMAVSGATLREIGTTNITRLADYERAIGPATGALMRVHPSNYRVRGFTKAVSLADLVALGRKHNLPVVDDVGSGAFVDFARFGLPGEPIVSQSIAAGADLVLCSGDKLLGGPQAGMIVGKKALVQRIEKDPLMRAFRLDKMTLAALEATLKLYLDPEQALEKLPTLRLLGIPCNELRERADRLAMQLRGAPGIGSVEVCDEQAYVGGGSLPDQPLPTVVVAIAAREISDADLARRLRLGTPAVMARVQAGRVLLDLRTVFASDESDLIEAVTTALANPKI